MSFDEFLFGKAIKYLKNKRQAQLNAEKSTVHLAAIKDKLVVLARALTGQPIDIYPAEKEGGYKNESYFLPESVALFDSVERNYRFYIFRVVYLSIQKQLNINWTDRVQRSEADSYRAARIQSEIILAKLFVDFPSLQDEYDSFYNELVPLVKNENRLSWLYGKLMCDELIAQPAQQPYHPDEIKKTEQQKELTVLKKKAVEEVRSLIADKKQQEDYVLTHNFEKVETADDFNGVWRDVDGDDELEKHEDALSELNMKFTVRVDDTAHSVLQSEFMENMNAPEVSETVNNQFFIPYDEWNFKKCTYLKAHCRLYPRSAAVSDFGYYQSALNENVFLYNRMRKMLNSFRNKRAIQRRQSEGSEFDLDATVDHFVDIHSHATPSDKIYLSNLKRENDVSIFILIDGSLSSDGYSDGNRIIDIEKKAALLFGEVLNENNVDFSIASFYSQTRSYAVFNQLKGFDESWKSCAGKVAAIDPYGFTRIGVALRHAGELLSKRDTKKKWLLLLSDGKPNDFDTYEGRYGINDVRQALRELKQKQVETFAFAIEKSARTYLPQLFGNNNYQVMPSLSELIGAMSVFYDRIRK